MLDPSGMQEGVVASPEDNGDGPAAAQPSTWHGADLHSSTNGAGSHNGAHGSTAARSSVGSSSRRRLPCIDEEEVAALSRCYGTPRRLNVTLPVDDYTRPYRFGRKGDRRAEVVFAIEDPSGGIWVHAKAHYPRHIVRLPSGGIHWREGVESALLREIEEETALRVHVHSFLGLIDYCFLHEGREARFASYIFHVRSAGGVPCPHQGEAITGFRMAMPSQLTDLASDMRGLAGDRAGWGQWRALAHELVHSTLCEPRALPAGSAA